MISNNELGIDKDALSKLSEPYFFVRPIAGFRQN